MANLTVLGNWHALSSCAQYVKAFRQLGHTVVTVGAPFTLEHDAVRWANDLTSHRWCSTQQAIDYVAHVSSESEPPDIPMEKGGRLYKLPNTMRNPDAILSFWAHGETPIAHWCRGDGGGPRSGYHKNALILGDTHTGQLDNQVDESRRWDQVFVQYRRADLTSFGRPRHWLPAAADPDIWQRPLGGDRPIDVLFVGSTHPRVHEKRVYLLEFLLRQGVKLRIEHAFGAKAADLMGQTKIVLNRSLAGDLNMRVPEALMSGACLVTDWVDGLEDLGLRPGRELEAYHAEDTCFGMIRELLNNRARREAIAAAGQAVALARHTYTARAKWLLETMGVKGESDGDTSRSDTGRMGNHRAVLRRDSPIVDPAEAPVLSDRSIGDRPGGDCGAPAHPERSGDPVAPKVSVIIPAFNHWDLTARLVEHLDDTLPEGVDVIVADDASTDHTREMQHWHGAWFLHRQENGGFSAACNWGAAFSKAEYLIFLNNDCLPKEGWLEPLLEALEDGAGIVGPLLRFPDGRIQSAGLERREDGTWWNKTDSDWWEPHKPEPRDAVTGACLGISRSLFWRLSGFDEGYRNGGEDADLCLRARQLGELVALVPDSEVVHAEGSTRFSEERAAVAQQEVAANTARLKERWGTPDDRRTTHGGTRGGSVGDRGGVPDAPEQLTVVWEGPTDVVAGGSLAHINRELTSRLKAMLSLDADAADVQVSHYFPGLEAHRAPPDAVKHWVIVQPWELGAPPPEWDATWQHPKFRRLLTPSEHSRQLFLQHTRLLPEQVTVIPNGVSLEVFTPDGPLLPRKEGEEHIFRFLFVGGLIWRKGVDLLYEAWRLAFRPDEAVRLIIKAQGSNTFYRGQTIVPPADLQNVLMRDVDASAEELATLYRSCDVVVCPSRAEGFGLPALEGMASGRPVIVPDCGALTEFVAHAAGLWVPTEACNDVVPHRAVSVEALAKSMRYLYEHRYSATKMGMNGREDAMAYSWDTIAARYAAVLREIAK